MEARKDVPAAFDVENVPADDISDPVTLNEAARDAEEIEHHQSLWEAIRAYPYAIFWSVMVSMCVIMEGYDTILIPNFYAYPTFAQKYGTYFPGVGYQLTASWQAALNNASSIGAFFGVLLNGWLVDKFGQMVVIRVSLIILACFIAIPFSAPNIAVLLTGEILCGLPWGVFAATSPAYASEVLPLSLRVYMTSYTNMCFVMGQFIAAGVLAGMSGGTTQWSYRIPFAIQWVWPALLFPILLFAPESPWHLVRKGKLEEAEQSLKRLQSKAGGVKRKQVLAAIVHTNRVEEELAVGTSYKDCFVGTEMRRTEIACLAFAGQVLSGLLFAYNSTYFFEQIGLSTNTTYNINLGGSGLALAGCLASWFIFMPGFGRRTIYVWGMFAMTAILFTIGFLNIDRTANGVGMTQAVLTLVWTFIYQSSVGALGWALPAEMGSTRLRQKTIGLARNSYYIVSVVGSVLQPYFMNPTEWNLRGYTGFFWGSTALTIGVWAFLRLPETKGRSFEDLDLLFENKVPTRKFKSYDVDAREQVPKETELAKGHGSTV